MDPVIAGFVDALNDVEKEAREKELANINHELLRLFLLTEVSLGLAAPFLKCSEIGGQSFTKKVVTEDSSGIISFDLVLSLDGDRTYGYFPTGPNILHNALDSSGINGRSYSFSVIFHSPNKEIKFNLSEEGLESTQSTPTSGRTLFKELYIESDRRLYWLMLAAIDEIHRKVRNFFRDKIHAIQIREGLAESSSIFVVSNAEKIVTWIIAFKKAYASSQKALQAYEPLISETCRALRDTKGFVKSKKLAEIRENLERKSKEIMASVNN